MKIPQSVFADRPAAYVQAAADYNGQVFLYSACEVRPDKSTGRWVPYGERLQVNRAEGLNLLDNSQGGTELPIAWWESTLTQREVVIAPPVPQMQPMPPQVIELPQSVFDDAPAWVKFAYYNLNDYGVYWCSNANKFGRTQRMSGSPVQPLPAGAAYDVTRRKEVRPKRGQSAPQIPQRQYGLPDPTVATTKRSTLELSADQCEKLLIESVLRHFPQMAGGNLSVKRGEYGVTVTAEVPL